VATKDGGIGEGKEESSGRIGKKMLGRETRETRCCSLGRVSKGEYEMVLPRTKLAVIRTGRPCTGDPAGRKNSGRRGFSGQGPGPFLPGGRRKRYGLTHVGERSRRHEVPAARRYQNWRTGGSGGGGRCRRAVPGGEVRRGPAGRKFTDFGQLSGVTPGGF